MAKAHFILEIIGVAFIFLIFGILFIYYYLPAKEKITGSFLGKTLDLNSRVYQPVERDLDALGVSKIISGKKRTDYKNLYSYWDEAKLQEEANSITIQKSPENESASTVVVLNYHGTIDEKLIPGKNNSEYSISVEDFKKHMFALKKAGYETISLNDLYLFLREEKKIPKKSFVLTFDDGIKETYYSSDPVLKALNYTAIMFVITGQSLEKNSPYYLNLKELHEMQNTGRWELESHSYKGHIRYQIDKNGTLGPFFSNKLWLSEYGRIETNQEYYERVYNDLKTSKLQLEKEFSKSVTSFAIPFGEFGQRDTNYKGSDRIITNITEQFFKLVFYQFKPAINKDYRANYNNDKKDFYLVMRISADGIASAKNLLDEMEAAQSLDLPYYENFENKKRWVNLWGRINFTDDKAAIYNNPGGGGAMAYLDGSYLWKDYIFSSSIKPQSISKVIMVARFQDSYNYAGCKYMENSVSVLKVTNKEKVELGEVKIDQDARVKNYLSGNPILSVSANGDKISCAINGIPISQASLNGSLQHGGIGLRLENLDSTNQNSITFSAIKAEQIS